MYNWLQVKWVAKKKMGGRRWFGKLKTENRKEKLATKSIYVIWHQETAMGRWIVVKCTTPKFLKVV